MAALLNLENCNGTRSPFALEISLLAGSFAGTETLSVEVARSQGDPAIFSTTGSWAQVSPPIVSIILSAANSSLLQAGNVYQLQVFATPSGGGDKVLIAWCTLTSLPSAGSGGLQLRSLVGLEEALDLLSSTLSTQQQDMLGSALEAATRTIEKLCRRILVLTDFDRVYRPGRTRKIYLDAWPVAVFTAPLSWGLDFAGTVQNMSSAVQTANVSFQPTSQYLRSVQSITLNAISNGVAATPIVFEMADYPTFATLLPAISAAGNGWQASAPTGIYNEWPTSRLNYQAGPLGAVNQTVELQLYNTDLQRYNPDMDHGVIELTQNYPEAYRYADRSFGIGFGWAWSGATEPRNSDVRAQYRAGYAVAQADIDLGYRPVPSNLKMLCLMTANAILQGTPLSGPVQSQSVNGRSYTLRSDPSVIPREGMVLLSGEINRRFGGWGTK